MKNNHLGHPTQPAPLPTTTQGTSPHLSLKDSGIPWLGHIPKHWSVLRIKNIFIEINERSKTGTEELLSVSHYTGVTKKSDSIDSVNAFLSNAKTLVGYKKVIQNDIVSNIMLAWNGSIGVSKYNGITSPAYCVYRIKSEQIVHYFGYLFSTALMKTVFRKKSFGIINSRLRLYSDKFFSIPLPTPPKAEQVAIASYLDHQCEKITTFIQHKQTLITLLKEQRQALISQAVTQGIKPNVTRKDSGIPWLGHIPKHWQVWPLRHICKITTGNKNTEDKVNNGNYPFYVRSQKIERINTYSFDGVGILTAGDGDIGKIFHLVNGKIDFHQRVYLFYEIINKVSPAFLIYYLKCNLIKDLMRYNAKSTVNSVRLPILKDFKVIIPPKAEQEEIVAYIQAETAKIDQTIAKAEKEIALIQEYKEAMIAEAVLGKLNHRIMGSRLAMPNNAPHPTAKESGLSSMRSANISREN